MPALTQQAQALLAKFAQQHGVTPDQVANLQETIDSSPALIEQINQAVVDDHLKMMVPLSSGKHAVNKCFSLNSASELRKIVLMCAYRISLLMLAALNISALPGCERAKKFQETTSENEQKVVDKNAEKQTRSAPDNPSTAKTIYPKALWGTWRLGPEPCQLPVNPDGDGRLHITGARIVGYETYSEPIFVTIKSPGANAWRIKSKENYLGSQTTEEIQMFEINENNLTVKGDGYEEKYVKCI